MRRLWTIGAVYYVLATGMALAQPTAAAESPLAVTAGQSPLEKQALQAYQAAQYKQAFDIWQPLASSGNAEAARALGFLYENGLGVNKSLNEALKKYEQAAQAGSVPAQYRAGQMYLTGEAGRQDFARAFTFLQSAAQAGNAGAQYNLGIMYEQGVGTSADAAKAAEWVGKAAAQGHDKASVKIAQLTPPSASPFEAPAAKSDKPAEVADAAAPLSPEHKQAQKTFNAREKNEPMNEIKWNPKAQKNENPHFFATDEEIKGTPLPPSKNTSATRPAGKMDFDSTNNPFDPARLPDPKRPAAGGSAIITEDTPAPTSLDSGPAPTLQELIPTPKSPEPVAEAAPPVVKQAPAVSVAPAPANNTVAALIARANHSPQAAFLLGRMYYKGDGVPQDLEKAKLWWQKAASRGYTPALTALENLQSRVKNGSVQ